MEPLYIGNVKLDNPLILAPMAGFSDLPYRRLCRRMGAGLVCMEMISSKAVCYHNRNTKELMEIAPDEHPVSLQIFGSDVDAMVQSVELMEDVPFDILDVNMGCPVPKVFDNGDGSALMKDPPLIGRIVSSLVKACNRPVTIKFRSGVDEDHINAPEIAHVAEESGAAAVAVHARTRSQYYSGHSDWDIIRQVKEKVNIPVLGSGDIHCADDVVRMREQTGCDGFMIARAARGNPWIFRDIAYELDTGVPHEPVTSSEIMEMLLEHARLEIEIKGEERAIREMRKHAGFYTAGRRGGSSFRRAVNEVTTYAQLEELCKGFLD